jgi:glycine/D-amino acid oxidase-like deaminating enzyme
VSTPLRIVVVGAGIVGAAIARALVRAGCDVTVVDRGPTAGGTSASGEGNLLVSDKEPGPELRLAQRSLAAWARIGDELRDELPAGFPSLELERKGGLVVATTEAGAQALLTFADTQRDAGVLAETVDDAWAHELEPDLTPHSTATVFYPEDLQVQPVAAARRHGARVHQGVEVTGPVLSSGRLVGVQVASAILPADAVVLAAGPWSGLVAERLGVLLPVRPRRGTVLVTSRMPVRIRHKVYDADYVGAVGSGSADLQVSSVVESTAGGTVLIGSSRERRGFDERIEARVLAALAAKALLLFPFLADAQAMRAYGGFRPFVPDHLPVIGADPRLPGLWHATGHEGAGIGLSLATAELLCDQLLDGSADPLADEFRLDRPTLLPHLEGAAR